jgi:hypothetical protein
MRELVNSSPTGLAVGADAGEEASHWQQPFRALAYDSVDTRSSLEAAAGSQNGARLLAHRHIPRTADEQ